MKNKVLFLVAMHCAVAVQAGTLDKTVWLALGIATGFTAADVYQDAVPVKKVLEEQVRSMTPEQAYEHVSAEFSNHIEPFQAGKDFVLHVRARAVHGVAAGMVVAQKYGEWAREHVTRA